MNRRTLLTLPAAICGLAALALVVASIASYGVADDFGYPAWMPTFGGLVFAIPALAIAVGLLQGIRRETAIEHNLNALKATAGSLILLVIAALTCAYVLVIADSDSYKGEFNPASQRYDPLFTQGTFMISSIVLAAFVALVLYFSGQRLYLGSVDHQRPEVEGPDPVGTLMAR